MREIENQERLRRNNLIRDYKRQLRKRSEFEFAHATRVAVYAVSLGGELGLKDSDLLSLRYAAELHDLGKIDAPDELWESETSRDSLMSWIDRHPLHGADLLLGIDWLEPSLPSIRAHHERWDGAGYPDRLNGEDIPLGARIIAVAEGFDAMTMPCDWRSPIREEDALEIIQKEGGSQFDPNLIAPFLAIQKIVQPVGL